MFEKLKSLFIVEEESSPKKDRQAASPSGKSGSSETGKQTPTPSPPTADGKVRTKFIEVLFGALEQANMAGFDYLEFKQSLQSLEKMPMDEATRFQSAMAMAEAMGAKRDALIQSAEYYLEVLRKEENKFKQVLKKQLEQKVLQRQKELEALQKSVKEKEEQIRQLTKQIETQRKKADSIRTSIEAEKQKIEATSRDFMASLSVLNEKISSDVEKMKQYLK